MPGSPAGTKSALVARCCGSSGYSASTSRPNPAPSSAAPGQSIDEAGVGPGASTPRPPSTTPTGHTAPSGRVSQETKTPPAAGAAAAEEGGPARGRDDLP